MDIKHETSERTFSSFVSQHALILFFAITLASSAGIAAVATILGNSNIAILSVLTPSLAALVLTALVDGRSGLHALFVKQTLRPFQCRWLILSILLFPLLALVAIGVHAAFGGPAPGLRTTALLPQIIVLPLIALGEEYGWRGYALPRLQVGHSALTASLVLGLFWGFWHFPGYLIGVGVPQDMPFAVFILWVVPATVLITWVYNHTRSVALAMLMHLFANAAFNYLPLLPEFTGQSTTFGIFLGLVWLVTIAVLLVYGPSRLSRQRPALA